MPNPSELERAEPEAPRKLYEVCPACKGNKMIEFPVNHRTVGYKTCDACTKLWVVEVPPGQGLDVKRPPPPTLPAP